MQCFLKFLLAVITLIDIAFVLKPSITVSVLFFSDQSCYCRNYISSLGGASNQAHCVCSSFKFILTLSALLCLALLPCRFLNPTGMFTAMAVVSGVFMGSVWAGENRAVINNFKRQNPKAFMIFVMVASYVLISMLGSVMVFMSAITLPLACKFKKIILILSTVSFWRKLTG